MEEQEIQDRLSQVLTELADLIGGGAGRDAPEAAETFEDAEIQTFEEAGVLTGNRGLVVRLASGPEFQITIIRSK